MPRSGPRCRASRPWRQGGPPGMRELTERLDRPPGDRQRLLLARIAEAGSGRAPGHRPVAIVGMAARVPGAGSLAGFWDLLDSGRDAITEVPAERWNRWSDGTGGPVTLPQTRW